MTDLLLFVLLRLILDNVDLLGLTVLKNVCNNSCTCNIGSTDRQSLAANAENLIEVNLLALSYAKLLNEDNVALGNLVLLSTCYESEVLFHVRYFRNGWKAVQGCRG